MDITSRHHKVLQDIQAFTKVKKYRGMLPVKLVVYENEDAVSDLVECGMVERILVDMPCGGEMRLLKLTDSGEDFLDEADEHKECISELPEGEPIVCVYTSKVVDCDDELYDLTKEMLNLLADVHHYSRIKRFGGMMPAEEAKAYSGEAMSTLLAAGCLVRIKAEMGGDKKRKGFILSEKGLRLVMPYLD